MKKFAILMLALALSLAVSLPALAFTDVEEDGYGAMARVSELGIMTGYADGSFKPYDDITRAEFAKVAVLAAEYKLGDKLVMSDEAVSFTDLVEGAWYTENITKAVKLGLMKGDTAGTFRPNDVVSEGEVITVLLRILGYDDNDGEGDWPANYYNLADKLENDSFPQYTCHDTSTIYRRHVAEYLNWLLDLPLKDDAANQKAAVTDYGVLLGVTDTRLTIYTARGQQSLSVNGYDFGSDKPAVGELVQFSANQAGGLLTLSRQNVQTNDLHEAVIKDDKIELNNKSYAFADDAVVLVMNSGGSVQRVELAKLLSSTYAASLRSSRYYAPLQYVLADNQVKYLLIGDYAGQSELHFGFIEDIAEGADGTLVRFYGDSADYEWASQNEEEPEVDALFAYVLKADGVSAYRVGVKDEQIQNAEVTRVGMICMADDGQQFIIDDDTQVMEIEYNEDGSIEYFRYVSGVEKGDIVRVRYSEERNSNNTGLEAAYVIIDATDK